MSMFLRYCNFRFYLEQDEKNIQKLAMKQHRVLKSATEFRYGYKLVVMFLVSASFSIDSLFSCVFFLIRRTPVNERVKKICSV